jgi:ATP-dependent protease ClpP protease subunit
MLDRDHYLVPSAAIDQGIIDQVLKKRPADFGKKGLSD